MEDLRRNSWRKRNEEDRISTLPDELIHRILSFGVELNVVVQTCVLSKRWVNLWSTFPVLNFKPLRFTLDPDFNYCKFITKFLINRNQQSETCSINIDFSTFDEFVTSMILYYAMSHSVRKFHISSASIDSKFSFPVLRNLSLQHSQVSLMDLSLPSLTTLHLDDVHYLGDKLSFKEFYCLKNLSLGGFCTMFHTMEVFRIDSLSLETLTMSHGDFTGPPTCKFVVSAPRLKCFRFYGSYVPVFSAEGGFPCLQEVDFDINLGNGEVNFDIDTGMYVYNDYNWEDENQVNEIIQKLISLFLEFRETKVLTLLPGTVGVLSRVPDFSEYQPSPFVNLHWLNLIDCMPPLLGYENPITPVNHVINYLLSNSPGARIFTKLLPMSEADDDTWDADYDTSD